METGSLVPTTGTTSSSTGIEESHGQTTWTWNTSMRQHIQFFVQETSEPDWKSKFALGVGGTGKAVAFLENETLSVIFYLDKKLSWWQRLVYSLAGFKYRLNQ